jgi:Holliday junction DNA helicase RuvA
VIASLRGPVLVLTATSAVIECGGVGLAVTLTPGARDALRQGEEARLDTHLVVREDSLTLYGFADALEREVFVTAQSVSGVGPRLALALLSTLGADGLIRAISGEDLAALSRVPGVGRKSAQKLVLALGGKLGGAALAGLGAGVGVGSGAGAGAGSGAGAGAGGMVAGRAGLAGLAGGAASAAGQVQAALESLGWPASAAADAVGTVLAGESAPADVPTLLRAALKMLGTSR